MCDPFYSHCSQRNGESFADLLRVAAINDDCWLIPNSWVAKWEQAGARTASHRPCGDGKFIIVPPLEPKSHRIIVSRNNGGTS
jgi:hypothetical protein